MKRTVLNLLLAGLILATGATGCRDKNKTVTDVNRPGVMNPDSKLSEPRSGTLPSETDPKAVEYKPGHDLPLPTDPMNTGEQIRTILAAETIYFDLDSATINSTEKSKLDKVADYLKANPTHDVLIEGHCDERGTEGYNLSLGERRALAAREYLASVGAPANNVYTRTFGETKPAMDGHDESAWSKNRRDEFVVVLP